MKTNRISDVTKIIIFAATIVVICVLCALGFKMANEGKSAVTSGTKKYNEMASKQMSSDVSVYDNSTVLGNELIRLINTTVADSEYLCISVINAGGTTNYNCTLTSATQGAATIGAAGTGILKPRDTRGDVGYINPDAQFNCALLKDADNNVVCMQFTQLD